ncbi:MAG: hypothetical protein IJW33_06715, partial [Lentisphaeria bacterium]|nr:hypothetical protein [Lentisphaeria bacterium]
FCQAVFPKAFFALAYGQFRALLSSQRSVSYRVCAFACSLQNPKFPHNPVQKIIDQAPAKPGRDIKPL